MARLEAIVDGKKRLFALSTPSTDSLFPARLVPAGGLKRLPARALPDLRDLTGCPHDLLGTYETLLHFPRFSVPVKFYVSDEPARAPDQSVGILGQDFMRAAGLDGDGFDWKRGRLLFHVGGKASWVNMGPAPHRMSEDALLQPTARRLTTCGFDVVVNGPFARRNPAAVDDLTSFLEECGFVEPGPPRLGRATLLELPDTTLVLLGLTAAGFGPDAEVLQLAARAGAETFNAYLVPSADIHPTVSKLTGLKKNGGALLLRGEAVKTVSVKQAVQGLLDFLGKLPDEVVLACHNAATSLQLLLRMAGSVGLLQKLTEAVGGLADTVPVFREKLWERAAQGGKFCLKSLVRDTLPGGVRVTNDALEDLRLLDKLARFHDVSEWQMIKASKPLKKFRCFKVYCAAPGASAAKVAA